MNSSIGCRIGVNLPIDINHIQEGSQHMPKHMLNLNLNHWHSNLSYNTHVITFWTPKFGCLGNSPVINFLSNGVIDPKLGIGMNPNLG